MTTLTRVCRFYARRVVAFVPPGWPEQVPPPETDDWQQPAIIWLLDQSPSHWRQDPVLHKHPVVLARRVVEHLCSQVSVARAAWVPVEQWAGAGLPTDAHAGVRQLLTQEGPALAGRLRAAELVRDALTTGRRWRPLL